MPTPCTGRGSSLPWQHEKRTLPSPGLKAPSHNLRPTHFIPHSLKGDSSSTPKSKSSINSEPYRAKPQMDASQASQVNASSNGNGNGHIPISDSSSNGNGTGASTSTNSTTNGNGNGNGHNNGIAISSVSRYCGTTEQELRSWLVSVLC